MTGRLAGKVALSTGGTRGQGQSRRLGGITDAKVLSAMAAVSRKDFVLPESLPLVRVDAPLSIPCGQTTSQPSLIALMLQALQLTGRETVLEVGTGLGYEAALLGRLAEMVWTIEIFPELAIIARANLSRTGSTNVRVVVGDGSEGLPAHAPYDAMVLAAAIPRLSAALVDQLAEGGRLVAPLGRGGDEVVTLFVKQDGRLNEGSVLTPARFVPMLATGKDTNRLPRRDAPSAGPR